MTSARRAGPTTRTPATTGHTNSPKKDAGTAIMMTQVPRTALDLGFTLVRLPLSVLELVSGHRRDREWAPAMAFTAARATMTSAVGGLLHDETLQARAETQRAALDELRRAAALETVADADEQRAAQQLEQRRAAARRRKREAEAAADDQSRRARTAAEQKERRAAKQAERTKEAARQTETRATGSAERAARRRRAEEITTEKSAVRTAQSARRSKARADRADAEIQRSAAERRKGR
ncbi:hypothetical protein [Dermatobacter hominis]|uniref:hypothetical protein n=1 Tax=Dermatobacter hominis TaxID=2884263 RepID=UPI001D12267F|nr:hypothetical protein [Dermatobacter hominis]UDY37631.1 hypothetical protein LH044_08845 [Dermatobacter hominis]